MAAPYMKREAHSDEIDDAWEIQDGDGTVIAIVDTELLANVLMNWLVSGGYMPPDFETGRAYGEAVEGA